ncbi:FAD-dependent oxidoreductase [Paenibacillus tritici]|uniref:FAD-dependent oxidoreductase n=1 Tax=Paenibacillus tritici TaxID=1873425 RepID=UPI0031BA4765
MAEQAKAIAVYDEPFWRKDGLSGFASSGVGPLQEIHDASPNTGSGALFGFFRMPPDVRQQLGEKEVLEQVKEQLIRLFGPSAINVRAIIYKDWSADVNTAISEDRPLQNFPQYDLYLYQGNGKIKLLLLEQKQVQNLVDILKVHFRLLNLQSQKSLVRYDSSTMKSIKPNIQLMN